MKHCRKLSLCALLAASTALVTAIAVSRAEAYGKCDVEGAVCDFIISPTSICVNGVGSNSIMPGGSGMNFIHEDTDCGWKWKRVAGVWVPAFTTCGDTASADCY